MANNIAAYSPLLILFNWFNLLLGWTGISRLSLILGLCRRHLISCVWLYSCRSVSRSLVLWLSRYDLIISCVGLRCCGSGIASLLWGWRWCCLRRYIFWSGAGISWWSWTLPVQMCNPIAQSSLLSLSSNELWTMSKGNREMPLVCLLVFQ